MRLPLIACLTLICAAAAAETPPSPRTAIVCDNLVTLRLLMTQVPETDAVPAGYKGCRAVPSDGIGDVEKRAMIGDAPYECRTIAGSACLWVRP